MNKKTEWLIPAEQMYVSDTSKTLEDIARIIPVSVRTLSEWKSSCKWDEKRKEYATTAVGFEEKIRRLTFKLVTRLDEMELEDITTGDVDKLTKLIANLERLAKLYDLRRATVVVMDKFITFLKAKHPEKLEEFYGLLAEFGEYVDKEIA